VCAEVGKGRLSLSFLSPYIRILYHGWTFCPRFCTHNLCRHILSFVRAAGERNGAGAKKSSRLPSSICMSQVCALLLAFGLENFRSFCDIKRNFYTSSTQGRNAHILIAVCFKRLNIYAAVLKIHCLCEIKGCGAQFTRGN
jgi:hypothetical protein